jgi:hypothetical protein
MGGEVWRNLIPYGGIILVHTEKHKSPHPGGPLLPEEGCGEVGENLPLRG